MSETWCGRVGRGAAARLHQCLSVHLMCVRAAMGEDVSGGAERIMCEFESKPTSQAAMGVDVSGGAERILCEPESKPTS